MINIFHHRSKCCKIRKIANFKYKYNTHSKAKYICGEIGAKVSGFFVRQLREANFFYLMTFYYEIRQF